ncbi:MAG: leucyl aminopeptidase [bacterium]|nr:leucyl aminopeptidase [bacterium]
MKISINKNDVDNIKTDAVIIPFFEDSNNLTGSILKIDKIIDNKIASLVKTKNITGKEKEIVVIHNFSKIKTNYIICAGLGKIKDITYNTVRKSSGNIIRVLEKLKCKDVVWLTNLEYNQKTDTAKMAQALIEGAVMGSYIFTKFKTDKKAVRSSSVNKISISTPDLKNTSKIIKSAEKGLIMGQAVNMARDLENTPANRLTPFDFMNITKDIFQTKSDISIDIIDRKKAESLGMEAFLGVARGSIQEPYMVILKYQPVKNQKSLWLVGKGVTFDAGGISIKPSKKMGDMKADMSGAASVLAAMQVISELKPEKNIVAIMPLTENLPSGSAQLPGDIVKAMNGKTIEIVNTDAEGRLIMADAICYAVKNQAEEIIDIATLTGACTVALGHSAAGIMGNKQVNINKMTDVSHFTGDRVWQLPLYDDYLDYLESDSADIKNCTETGGAGTVTAGKFLEQFIDTTPWMHMDIASVMDYSKTDGYAVKGMSGYGVRNIVEYILLS